MSSQALPEPAPQTGSACPLPDSGPEDSVCPGTRVLVQRAAQHVDGGTRDPTQFLVV